MDNYLSKYLFSVYTNEPIRRGGITLASLRNSLLFWVVGLYMLLNYGFMQMRIPPVSGSGIPIGELILLYSLATINYSRLLLRLIETVFLVPFLIWWVLGFSRAIAGVPEYGMWALRDASHVIESLFLIIGFAFAGHSHMIDRFFRWLPKILLVICIYALGYPFAEYLSGFSPVLVAGAGHRVPLFFTYIGTPVMLLMSAAYIMLFNKRDGSISGKMSIVAVVFLMGFTIFLFQARTIYLQIIGIFLLFALYRKDLFGRGVLIISLVFGCLLTISVAGLQIKGRLGQAVSLDFLINHFLAIGGVENSGLEGVAGGVSQRLGWWLVLYDRWVANVGTFLFGLGYGFPLVNFVAHGSGYAESGQIVREPHNSYISVLARIGLVGAFVFAWMHFLLLRSWRRAYKICKRINWQEGEKYLLILMVFFVLIWINAIGEDAFEKPFFAIPYYFFWGIALRMYWHLKNTYLHLQEKGISERSN